MIREDVAEFIERRDERVGSRVDPEMVFLSDGASTSVKVMLTLLIKDKFSGVCFYLQHEIFQTQFS